MLDLPEEHLPGTKAPLVTKQKSLMTSTQLPGSDENVFEDEGHNSFKDSDFSKLLENDYGFEKPEDPVRSFPVFDEKPEVDHPATEWSAKTPRGQCYKTFYGHKLQRFIIS